LTDAGFLPVTIRYTDGVGRFSGEVVGRDILRSVLEVARDVVGVSVRNISHIETNDSTHPAVHDVEWNLTPAQQEALQTAYLAGYLNVPRDVTAEAVADELDISKSAFLQRLRRAQYNYFRQIFDAGSADTEPN
jgi:predicted DNA binding protein